MPDKPVAIIDENNSLAVEGVERLEQGMGCESDRGSIVGRSRRVAIDGETKGLSASGADGERDKKERQLRMAKVSITMKGRKVKVN